jgi:hypothetical protein
MEVRLAVRSFWFKWVMIIALLIVSSGGHAHAVADHAVTEATPCAAHDHHHHDSDHSQSRGAAAHQDCCCSCAYLTDLITPAEPTAPRPLAYDLRLAPEPAARLASRFLSPELDPPRPSALSPYLMH